MPDEPSLEPAGNEDPLSRLDTSIPHPARVYDVALGGKDNFAVDREAAEAAMKFFPQATLSARASRAFLARVVRHLAAEAGIRQFLDIGTGLPSANNVHEVAQSVAPESRIVYVDNDPMVLQHAQVLLTSSGTGATDYLDADLREPEKILEGARRVLDFAEPVAILLFGVLHFVAEGRDPYGIVDTLRDAVPAGSYLAISHLTMDFYTDEMLKSTAVLNQTLSEPVVLRDRAQVTRFFDGLELVEPGVVQVSKWRPESELESSAPAALWGGIARKTA